jgi:hypothetical protein
MDKVKVFTLRIPRLSEVSVSGIWCCVSLSYPRSSFNMTSTCHQHDWELFSPSSYHDDRVYRGFPVQG